RSTATQLDRFKGTWACQGNWPEDLTTTPPTAPMSEYVSISVQKGTATVQYQATYTLTRQQWGDLPAPYNTAREVYFKLISVSEKVQVSGSTLSIRWGPWKIVGWAPKMPKSVLLESAWTRKALAYVERIRDWAFELIGPNELKLSGSKFVFHRLK